ncbi:MAG: hypothetical protein M3327_04390 [Actinomycetota bacterium]|nr:hypothetical protein [Actinomycetota bacterium]
MKLDLHLADGRKLALQVENERALYELLNGEGGYQTGWAQTSTGEYVRLSQVVSVRALDRP